MLKKELESAIAHRRKLEINSNGEWFRCIPIEMDLHWLRVICINTDPMRSAHWLIRLDSIGSVSTAQCDWSNRVDLWPELGAIDRDKDEEDEDEDNDKVFA